MKSWEYFNWHNRNQSRGTFLWCRHGVYSCFFSHCRGETENWGVWVLVKGQVYHLQGPETQKLGLLICFYCWGGFKINTQGQSSLPFSDPGSSSSFFPIVDAKPWFHVVDVCSTPLTHQHSTYGLMAVFFSCFCCSYSIIKNPLNFDVHHKVCAPVNASTDNYFWWINQKDKYVRSSSCSFQFSLYTSPAGAIVVMLQLVISVAWLSPEMDDDSANLNLRECQCFCGHICR